MSEAEYTGLTYEEIAAEAEYVALMDNWHPPLLLPQEPIMDRGKPDNVERLPQFADPDAVIGHIVPHPSGKGYGILCLPCILTIRETHPCFEPAGAAVYGININPYKVVCVHCEKVVVEGCGVELYDGK